MENGAGLPLGAALIGDVVGSRKHSNRATLHERLRSALDETNHSVPSIQGLSLTVGDEFQGVYADLGSAIHAALIVRLRLFGFADLRFGVGWGSLQVFESHELPFAQDGPAWWAARRAIDFLKRTKKQSEIPRGLGTACSIADPSARVDGGSPLRVTPLTSDDLVDRSHTEAVAACLNAFLLCRDELVARLTPRQAQHLLTLLEGHRQADIARAEGVSDSAVSQRAMKGGLYAILQAHRMIRSESQWFLLSSG